jgi:hypothetical protein
LLLLPPLANQDALLRALLEAVCTYHRKQAGIEDEDEGAEVSRRRLVLCSSQQQQQQQQQQRPVMHSALDSKALAPDTNQNDTPITITNQVDGSTGTKYQSVAELIATEKAERAARRGGGGPVGGGPVGEIHEEMKVSE